MAGAHVEGVGRPEALRARAYAQRNGGVLLCLQAGALHGRKLLLLLSERCSRRRRCGRGGRREHQKCGDDKCEHLFVNSFSFGNVAGTRADA